MPELKPKLEPMVACVPNFSEGVDEAVVRAIVAAMQVDEVRLLDWSMDSDHNRSVVTIAGPPAAVMESAVRGVVQASKTIDLTRQTGVHPRIGAADVIPFVPVQGIALEQCALVARQCGAEIWRRAGVPVYFYEAAAARPDRANLEDVRRGQFERLREAAIKEPMRRPDLGGPGLHPTAGASAVGARKVLVAYNIYFDSPEVSLVRALAKDLRASSGGMKGVKALGVLAHGRAQLSMNITDLGATPMSSVFARVCALADKHGAEPASAEIIGLLPEVAYEQNSDWLRLLDGFDPARKVLERRLESPLEWPEE
ncbi:MAG TPA: glutamate formimidoyltransferase [Acidobacteriaceae bacterium]|jgi:glutamate formiminotransferase|nr:glutamate formimidoyltransferase [Acidobacteriaceae bacterium]